MREITRREILPSVHFTCVQTDGCRTGCLSVFLVTELKRDTAAKNALLPRVLRRGTAEFPDVRALSEELDRLYGGEIRPAAVTWGEAQGVGFVSRFTDDAALPKDAQVTEKMIRLTGSMFLDPVTRGGMLLSEYVESEREKLCGEIAAALNRKAVYAAKLLRANMCQGERYAVGRLGEEAQAKTIGYQGLTKHYRRVLSQAQVEIVLVSSMDAEKAARLVEETFSAMPRGAVELRPTQILYAPKQDMPRVFREKADVAQGRLVMGFRLGEGMREPDYGVIAVFEKLFGGGPSSVLFSVLRQEKALCYSVKGQADMHKGVLFVSVGTDPAKFTEAAEAVRECVLRIFRGEFDDAALESAKRAVRNEVLSAADDPAELSFVLTELSFMNLACTPEEYAGLADCVTKKQIMDFASGIREDALCLLSGEEAEA